MHTHAHTHALEGCDAKREERAPKRTDVEEMGAEEREAATAAPHKTGLREPAELAVPSIAQTQTQTDTQTQTQADTQTQTQADTQTQTQTQAQAQTQTQTQTQTDTETQAQAQAQTHGHTHKDL